MKTQINMEWAQSLLSGHAAKEENMAEQRIDWVQNGKAFKRNVKFKVMPPNSRENGIFSFIVGTHWSLGPNGDKRIICTETTTHLKKHNIPCPVCEAKRQLLAKGFKEEELTVAGKYGPMPVFDPKITSNVKVVVMESDLRQDWDQKHISVLQQNGDFLTRWLVERQTKADNPDFIVMGAGNCIEFSRPSDTAKWTREPSFTMFNPTEEVLAKLREENEALYMPDVWKMPSDQEIMQMRAIMQETIKGYEDAKTAVTDSVKAAVSSFDDDQIPF